MLFSVRNKCITILRARLCLSPSAKAARQPALAVHIWFRALAHAASRLHHIALAPDDTVAEPSITIIAHIHAKIHADTTSIGHTICTNGRSLGAKQEESKRTAAGISAGRAAGEGEPGS